MLQRTTPSRAGARILDAAEELFYGRGITAVGVDLIAQQAGTTKRTLYNQFGSKDQLVVEYLSARDARWRKSVEAAIVASDGPVEAVTAPFLALQDWVRTNPRGCAFINALAELPDEESAARGVALTQKRWLKDRFAQLAAAADCEDPETLADALLVLHEGALATRPLAGRTVEVAVDVARSLVRAATSA